MIYISNELSNHITRFQSCQMYITFPVFFFHKELWIEEIFSGRSSKSREYSYRQSNTCPQIECKSQPTLRKHTLYALHILSHLMLETTNAVLLPPFHK